MSAINERRMSAKPYECPWSGYECTNHSNPLCETCLIYTESKAKRNLDLNQEGLCKICGADQQAYLEMMGEECRHGHGVLK